MMGYKEAANVFDDLEGDRVARHARDVALGLAGGIVEVAEQSVAPEPNNERRPGNTIIVFSKVTKWERKERFEGRKKAGKRREAHGMEVPTSEPSQFDWPMLKYI